jgi:hypothetical protein
VAAAALLLYSAVPGSLRRVEAGATRTGRSLADVAAAVSVRTCVTDEREVTRETLARQIMGWAIVNAYGRFFAECGFAGEVEAVNAAWKAGDRAGAVKGSSGTRSMGSARWARPMSEASASPPSRAGVTPVVVPSCRSDRERASPCCTPSLRSRELGVRSEAPPEASDLAVRLAQSR